MGIVIVLLICGVILVLCIWTYLRSHHISGGANFDMPSSSHGYLCFPEPENDHEAAVLTVKALMNVIPDTSVKPASKELLKEVYGFNPKLPRTLSDDDCRCILKRYQMLDYINADRDMVEFARSRGIMCSYYIGGRILIDELRESMNSKEVIAFFIACVGCNEDGVFFGYKWDRYMTAAEKLMETDGFIDSFEKQFEDASWFYDCGTRFRQTKAYKLAKEADNNV